MRSAVFALYRGLLQRDPDEAGLQSWTTHALNHGLESVVHGILDSDEYARVSRTLMKRNLAGHWSLSEYRDVELLISLMLSTVVPSPVIVDVGAAGVEISNSVDLIASLGWSGLLVEAIPRNAERLARDLEGMNATVVNCAVDVTEGEGTFYLGVHDFVSSLKRDQAEAWGRTRGEITVTKRRLDRILAEHDIPHDFAVLSLDIEGLDMAVLDDFVSTSPYRPKWVIIEWGPNVLTPSMDDERIGATLRAEYSIVAGTLSNVILQHRSVATRY